MNFHRKVAVITGGAQGIGREIAEQLMREGCAVAILDISDALKVDVISAADRIGGKIHFEVCDVADEQSVDRAVSAVVNTFGGIDYLVNGGEAFGFL